MLIGYNEEGIIEFIFTDDAYLAKKYPDNSAKVTDFWGPSGSHLKELFVEVPDDFNYKMHKVVNGKIIKLDKPLPEENPIKIIVEEKSSGPAQINIIGENIKNSQSMPKLYGGQI